jgi:anti-sigma factor RsiW
MTNSEDVSMMSCGEARRLAWPDAGPRAVGRATEAAMAHVAQCAACQSFIADMQAMASGLASHAPRPAAPREVRERIFARIAQARSEREFRRANRFAVTRAAAVVVVVMTALALLMWRVAGDRETVPDPLSQLAGDHRRATGAEGMVSSDTTEVAGWLSSRVGFAVHVPIFAGGDLLGARVHDLDGRRGAVIAYRIDGRNVSYYLMPTTPLSGGTPVPDATTGPAERVATWAGFRVAFWNEPGLTHAIVADLPASRVADLAHECIRRMAVSGFARPRDDDGNPLAENQASGARILASAYRSPLHRGR